MKDINDTRCAGYGSNNMVFFVTSNDISLFSDY